MRRAFDVFLGVSLVTLVWLGLMRLGGIDAPLHVQLIGGVVAGLVVEGMRAFWPRPRNGV